MQLFSKYTCIQLYLISTTWMCMSMQFLGLEDLDVSFKWFQMKDEVVEVSCLNRDRCSDKQEIEVTVTGLDKEMEPGGMRQGFLKDVMMSD